MPLVIRPFEDRDRDGFAHVRSMVYRGGEQVRKEEQLLQDDCIAHLAEIDGQVVAACTGLDMRITLRGSELKGVGVAGVGVLPERRNTGVGGELMRSVLPLYRDLGHSIALLHPFRDPYYRKFGYEGAGTRIRITAPAHRLPMLRDSQAFSLLQPEDHGKTRPCYEAFARRYSGMNLRGETMWWRQLGGDTPFSIYAAGEPIEAFVVLRLVADFWEEQAVRDLVWSTPRGYRGAVAFLSNLAINKSKVQWQEPGDGPFIPLYWDQGIRAEAIGPLMYRVLDVKTVLSGLRSEAVRTFAVAIRDPILPQNEGSWNVCSGPEEAEVNPSGVADFELDIGRLTQALLGEPSLAELERAGEVKVVHPSGFENALSVLGPHRTYCTDLF